MVRETPLERTLFRWLCLAYVVAVLGVALWFRLDQGAAAALEFGTIALTSFVVLGKVVIFYGLKAGSPSIWTIALLVFAIDLGCAFAIGAGMVQLERVPHLGDWLRSARERARAALAEYPGLKRLAFFGVVAFVLIPVAGAGAITGSFVARLLGLTRVMAVGAIALASGVSSLGFALLARFLGARGEALVRNPLLITAGVVVALGLGWAAYRTILKELRRPTAGDSPARGNPPGRA